MDLAELGKVPISDDSPAGADVRYEPEFEQLQGEIDKLSSPTAQGGPDWKKVVEISSEILEKKSKDLLVASYLAAGLMHTQQVEGLSLGLKIFADVLESFWENLFPPKKRMRGRRAAIEWLADRTEAALAQMEGIAIEAEKGEQLTATVERIESFLGENLEDPPSFSSILRFIQDHQRKPQEAAAPETEQPPPLAASSAQAEAPRPAVQAATIEDIASVDDAKKVLKSAMQKIRQAAGYLGETNLADPHAYRLRRIAIWSLVEGLPPATDGKTKIPPPPAQVKGILENLYEEQNWESLVKAAEARIGEFIYWLDLHFYAGQSLASMGDQYEKAHEELCRETAYFLHRFPGIESMEFSDGTPFASEETRKWLQGISLAASASISEDAYPSEAALKQMAQDVVTAEINKARGLAKKRKLVEAISLLQDHLRSAYSDRERLLWRLGICQVLLEGKKGFLAVPHLDQILHYVDTYCLEQWEPELALKALKMTWAALSTSANTEDKKRAEQVLGRIARLDATEALKLKPRL